MSRYLQVGRSAEYETRLRRLLGAALVTTAGDRLGNGVDAVAVSVATRPAVAALGPYLSFDETRGLAAALEERFPGVGLVLVKGERGEIEDWMDSIRVDAVLDPEALDSDTVEVISALEDQLASSGRYTAPTAEPIVALDDEAPEVAPPEEFGDDARSRIIAVAAPKGGQGKTTVAVNLAVALCDGAPRSVVLVDGDVQFGDVANALELPAGGGLLDALDSGDDDLALKAALRWHPSGVFVLAAPRSPVDADEVDASRLAALLDRLRATFRYVVVDTAPGLGEHTLAVLDAADQAVFVSNLSVPALRALRTELEVLARLDLGVAGRRPVLNFVDRQSGLTPKDAARIAGVEFDAVVPRSPGVLLASNAGEPLVRRDPKDPAARALRDLALSIDPAAVAPRRTGRAS